MSIYLSNGKRISKEEFYNSKYNDVFKSAYQSNPDNLKKALEKIKSEGCNPTEACIVLSFVLQMDLGKASMLVQEVYY